jgi:putative chitinase
MLATPTWAAMGAAVYWIDNDLNRYADAGDVLALTKRINGGTNGIGERQMLTSQALAAYIMTGHPL